MRIKKLVTICLSGLSLLTACTRQAISEDETAAYLEAKKAYETGDLKHAEENLRQLIPRAPRFYQAHLLLAKSLFYQNKVEEADSVLSGLLKKEPRYREAELLFIRVLIRQEKYEDAEDSVKRLLAYDSSDPRLLYAQALLSDYRNDTADSLFFLKKAALFAEEFARVFIDLGRIYYLYGQDEEANRHLSTAIHLIPEESPLHNPVMQILATITKKEEKRND